LSSRQKNPVALSARLAIALELLQAVAACVAAFAAWPRIPAYLVVLLAVIACVLQFRRWSWMLSQ
jgi:hypothetical protein